MPDDSHPSSSSSSARLRKRRWTRDQLHKALQMIGDLGTPLPSTLPPSPPPSRAASPVVGFKRKIDSSTDSDPVKRPRTNPLPSRTSTQRHPPSTSPTESANISLYQSSSQTQQPQPPSISHRQSNFGPLSASARSEPEDGEVREEEPIVIPVPRGSTIDVPIRRPKKGRPSFRHFDDLYDKYHQAGRILKYSGDARFWSTYPPGHKEHRPLLDPPHPSSPYHKHGGLIARLELLDALVCFTYSIWNKDYGRRTCIVQTWSTIEPFVSWCKQKWQIEEGTSDAERAFLGLVYMIEAFIRGRNMYHSVHNSLDADMDKVLEGAEKKIASAAAAAVEADPVFAASLGLLNGKAPPMLPSPSSSNSTPANRDEGTPSNNTANAATRATQAANHAASRESQYTGSVPFKLLPQYIRESTTPIPPHVMTAMSNVGEPINSTLVQSLKDLTTNYNHTVWCTQASQQTLNLPILRRCFPQTWARMMYSTLSPTEEHEPDFEDEEGELYWPDQCVNGEGIGWVCLMGKAMITEFGKAYGYKGLEGAVPKPKPGDAAVNPPPPSYTQATHSQRQGPPPTYTSQAPSQRSVGNPSGAPR
ncbi:hypothetical protein JR316_0001924 [Psilocybe cubensis]|uniref:Uncharacterized protein n=2 Tax=Psilocybe cubensis TaxID=181762 RepID=A0A8H7Y6Z4_PSICU|nr:hypothetical protein JR316_0001924 [Psilocybe cubensis]KAH9485020.1 hypothetical protein JR316_0001924 [Psilocybe cubensis]